MRLPVRIIRIVLIISLISGMMAIPAYVISDHHRDTVIEELQTRAANIAAMVSVLISVEMESYRALVSVDDYTAKTYDDVTYLNLNTLLHQIQHETQADFIFTEKRLDEETVTYIWLWVHDGQESASSYRYGEHVTRKNFHIPHTQRK